jgi:hypothetical protein
VNGAGQSNTMSTITNGVHGVITGNIPTGESGVDGDGIDVDYLVNIKNYGQILAVGQGSGTDDLGGTILNEALAIGGGTVTNYAGGLIQSDQRAITVDNSEDGPAYGAFTLDNAGTITGKDGEAIVVNSNTANTLFNRSGGVINGSVAFGGSGNTYNLYTGSQINGALTGSGSGDTIHLIAGDGTSADTGKGTLSGVTGVNTLKVDGGNWNLKGSQGYASGVTVASGATAQVSNGVGETVTTLGGDVTNNGTVKVEDAKVVFTGTFTNNGALVSDPATLSFNNLSTGANGYIQAAAGDTYQVAGNFDSASTQSTAWVTQSATLEFTGADGTGHAMQITGADLGLGQHRIGNFGWGEVEIDSGNTITLTDGVGSPTGALYLTDLVGADISGDMITNIFSSNGLNIYYDGHDAADSYLHGLSYFLMGGGRLISDVPEPQTWSLLIAGFGLMGAAVRRRRRLAAGAGA